jgi:glycogen debranching enzyme
MANTGPARPVRVLQLQRNGCWDSKLFKLKTGFTLRFTLAPCLYAKHVVLKTDYPAPGTLYKRNSLRTLKWTYSTKEPHWDPDRFVELKLDLAGPYRFVYETGNTASLEDGVQGSGYFVVDPELSYSPDGLACQTYVTKLLGPLSEWKERLRTAVECGYNMVHLTPIQQLGSSRSAYSISNQLRIDSSYLPPGYSSSEKTVSYRNSEGKSKELKVDQSYVEVRQIIKDMHKNWGLLAMVDVVWNHTSFDTPWLLQHPEAGYNLINSPHLRPAYALDVALVNFSREIADGKWINQGIAPEITQEGHIHNICFQLLNHVLPRERLWEYLCVDVEAVVSEFRSTVYRLNGGQHPRPEGRWLEVTRDKQYRRLGVGVDIDLTLELFNIEWPGVMCFEERIERCCADLRGELTAINRRAEEHVRSQLQKAVNNVAAHIRYEFLESHGPQRRTVTHDHPLVPRYFTVLGRRQDLRGAELESTRGEYVLSHNGWVMNADPLVNFANEGSQVYFQRELIVWGDSVKLRYGDGPADSPWLWDHMKKYTQAMAWIFDGFRLDNCHNTPVGVAEALLDSAREVNPQLYLVAELFTSSEEKDNYFVNRLGINSLVREALSAHNAREEGRLVYKYGGDPVASFLPHPTQTVLKPSVAHAIFMDTTHDNDPGLIGQRSVYDALPNSALVGIASCASGSCAGYDQLVPHMIGVVKETRQYPKWTGSGGKEGEVGLDSGIMAAQLELNRLHKSLADEGFDQVYVDQVTEEIVAVTRHSPSTHQSVILMAHTAFSPPQSWAVPTTSRPDTNFTHVPPLTVPGRVSEIVLEARLLKDGDGEGAEFQKSERVLNGLVDHVVDMRKNISLGESRMCRLAGEEGGSTQEVVFTDFCPGSIIIFRVSLVPSTCKAICLLRSFLDRETTTQVGTKWRQDLATAVGDLDLLDLNYALYRCDQEERDDGHGGGAYVVPGAGAFVYCGVEGIMSMMKAVRDNNDLGHPLCDNLRSGDWLAGYTVNRLRLRAGTKKLAELLECLFSELSKIPRYLIPCYFEATVSHLHSLLRTRAVNLMSSFVRDGPSTVQALAMGSVQLYGDCHSAHLPPSLPDEEPRASLAAGLPHFSTGFMRCWGRDTFIALRGLFLVTGRFREALDHLLSFAACMRHGLIPNLLSGGTNPRYNCRDAPWWWLQSLQDYWKMAPDGKNVLQLEVRRIFQSDESQADFGSQQVVVLAEVVQEILQRHAQGTAYRERGAGPNLDRDMTPPGFNVEVGVDEGTGFVYGGSVHNCGTWMDKVGESTWAGNKGAPATPRDGSAVELVGLSYSAILWLHQLYQLGQFPYSRVNLPSDDPHSRRTLTYSKWASLIKESFEHHFWIPLDRNLASQKEGTQASYLHRTGIYKDCVGSTQRYANFQLRPNFSIAMVVAPELFSPENAWTALQMAEELLLGPLGMRTLDPGDYVYNGYYINSVDSGNYNTAKGFNYHQGPEWLWVVGYFLRARLQFAHRNGVKVSDNLSLVHSVLSTHAQALQDSPWKGLPELTNKDGTECVDSCPVQAWSMATILDVLHDLKQYS